MSLTVYLGIDVGSVTTKLALIDETGKYVDSIMLKTAGTPVAAVQNGMRQLYEKRITDYDVMGVGTTGSGRALAGSLVGADVVKNEITAHAVAASVTVPGVQTILEIGGQDSKIIIMRDGIVTDFAMNTVCAVHSEKSRVGISFTAFLISKIMLKYTCIFCKGVIKMSYVQGTKDVNGVLGVRVNHGNPNRMTGKGKGVITGMPTKMTAKEVLSVRNISTTQRMSGKGKVGPVNPARPDRLRADTYSRTCSGACMK